MIDKLKKIASNGLPYGISLFILSHVVGYTFNIPTKSVLLVSLPISLFSFIINGLIYTRFTKSLKVLQAIRFTAEDIKNLKLEAIANHLVENDLVSGKLCLTDNELIFITYNQEEYRWPIISLKSFDFYVSIFNKGGEFVIKNQDDRKLMFEVDHIKPWKTQLLKT